MEVKPGNILNAWQQYVGSWYYALFRPTRNFTFGYRSDCHVGRVYTVRGYIDLCRSLRLLLDPFVGEEVQGSAKGYTVSLERRQ